MKNKKLVLMAVWLLQSLISSGQQNTLNSFQTPSSQNSNNGTKAHGMPAPTKGKEVRSDTVKDLRFKIQHKNELNEVSDPKVEEIKKWKNKLRIEGRDSVLNLDNPIPIHPQIQDKNVKEKTTAAPAIYLNHNFSTTDDPGWVPNDNSVAISNSGIIVSTTNSNITIQDTAGTILVSNSLNAFFGYPTTDILYDAKVIYDDVLDRFFVVVLSGTTPSTSKLIVGYPTTTNPLGSWSSWYFVVPTLCAGNWMDYPSIGINDSSLYATVNAYNSSNSFQYPIIFRLPKTGMLSGVSGWTWQYYYNPLDDYGNGGFTICPLSYGQAGLYGHTMGFVSTVGGGANYVQFWTWNIPAGTVAGTKINSFTYQIGSDALQSGSSNLLDVGNCRVKDGFLLYNPSTTNWNIYFTFTSISSLSAIANYAVKAKLVWNNTGVTIPPSSWTLYGNTAGDFCYPSIASYGTTASDENVLMSSNVSFSTTNPYYVVYSSDVSNNFSGALTIKAGDSYLNEYSGTKHRWGDYTHLSRKQNEPSPIVWSSGCYGKSDNTGGTWIGEIAQGNLFSLNTASIGLQSGMKLYPNPTSSNFSLEFKTEKEGFCSIQLIGADGKYSHQLYNDKIPDGEHKISLSTHDLSSGNYIIEILSDGELIKREKLSVIR